MIPRSLSTGFRIGILSIVALFFSSCAPHLITTPTEIPPLISASDAVRSLAIMGEEIKTIRGAVTIKTYNGDGVATDSITGYIAYERPDKMRFTYIAPFGITLFEAVMNGNTIALFLPQEMTAYVGAIPSEEPAPGSTSAMLFSRLRDLPFSKPNGDKFLIEHIGADSVLFGIVAKDDRWEITEKLIFSRADMRPKERVILEDGVVVFRITYSEYLSVDRYTMPGMITAHDLKNGITMEYSLASPTFNEEFPEGAFDVKAGDPWKVKDLKEFSPPSF